MLAELFGCGLTLRQVPHPEPFDWSTFEQLSINNASAFITHPTYVNQYGGELPKVYFGIYIRSLHNCGHQCVIMNGKVYQISLPDPRNVWPSKELEKYNRIYNYKFEPKGWM